MFLPLQELKETWVLSLDWEEEMATYSSIFVRIVPWREESGGLRFMGLKRVGHD